MIFQDSPNSSPAYSPRFTPVGVSATRTHYQRPPFEFIERQQAVVRSLATVAPDRIGMCRDLKLTNPDTKQQAYAISFCQNPEGTTFATHI